MEERRKRKGAAQGFLENVIFIEQDAWYSITSNRNRLQEEAAYW